MRVVIHRSVVWRDTNTITRCKICLDSPTRSLETCLLKLIRKMDSKTAQKRCKCLRCSLRLYRETALKALEHTTVVGEHPKVTSSISSPIRTRLRLTLDRDQVSKTHILTQKTKKGQAPPETVIFDQGNRSVKFNLSNHLPDQGTMRITLRAGRSTMKTDEFASLRFIFSAHTSNNANFSEVISKRAIPVTGSLTEPQLIHLDIPLSEIQRNPFRNNKETFPRRDEFLTIECQSRTRGKEPLSITR